MMALRNETVCFVKNVFVLYILYSIPRVWQLWPQGHRAALCCICGPMRHFEQRVCLHWQLMLVWSSNSHTSGCSV
jgi:hypothetical protein